MRTIVDLPKDQIEALDSYGKAKGISRAAAVREAVAAYLPKKKKQTSLKNHPSFGSWKTPKNFDLVEDVQNSDQSGIIAGESCFR